MNNVAQILSSTGFPAILCVSADDRDLNIKAFVDTVEKRRITILSNLSSPFSPISGARMAKAPVNSYMEVASSLDDLADRFPVVACCLSCDHDTLVAAEVAIDMDGETISCSNCGNDIEVSYYGDLLGAGEGDEDTSEDDLAETTEDDEHDPDAPNSDIVDAIGEDSEDDKDTLDSEDDLAETTEDDDHGPTASMNESDVEDPTADSEDEDTTDKSEDEDKHEAEDTADEEEHEDEDTTDEDKHEDDSETASFTISGKTRDIKQTILETADKLRAESLSSTNTSVTLSVASMSDVEDDLRLVACDPEMSRIEVFKGSAHIGRLLKAEASDTVRPLFNKPDNLHVALSVALSKSWDDLASDDAPEGLTDYGFKASSVDVDIDNTSTEVLSEIVDSTKQQAEDEVEERVAEAEEAFVKSLTIAMAGINKGVLDGPNFLTEISATLERYGVARAPEVAKRLVEKVSEPFLTASLEHATTLREEGIEYTRGMSKSIEQASYPSTTETSDTDVVTASVMSQFVPGKPSKVIPIETAKSNHPDRFRNAFRSIGRRR